MINYLFRHYDQPRDRTIPDSNGDYTRIIYREAKIYFWSMCLRGEMHDSIFSFTLPLHPTSGRRNVDDDLL